MVRTVTPRASIVLAACLAALAARGGAEAVSRPLQGIPAPASVKPATGSFRIEDGIPVEAQDPRAEPIARYLAERIDVFVLDEPTRGVDVGARKQIYDLLFDLAESGKTLLIISSDLAEVAGIADRVLVMRGGELVGDVPRSEATPERLVRLALPN